MVSSSSRHEGGSQETDSTSKVQLRAPASCIVAPQEQFDTWCVRSYAVFWRLRRECFEEGYNVAYQDEMCDTAEYNRDGECCSEERAAPLVMRVSVKVVMGRAESFIFLLRVGISL